MNTALVIFIDIYMVYAFLFVFYFLIACVQYVLLVVRVFLYREASCCRRWSVQVSVCECQGVFIAIRDPACALEVIINRAMFQPSVSPW